jgi:hypothetical protein
VQTLSSVVAKPAVNVTDYDMSLAESTDAQFEQQSVLSVTFLVKQHKAEILDNADSLKAVLAKTFNREFLNMLQVCVFVPFLHPETPKPYNITQD